MTLTQTRTSDQRLVWAALAAYLLAKAADMATTVVGLQLGYVERHPVIHAVVDALGTPGAVVGMAALVLAVIVGVESLANCLRRRWSARSARQYRTASYGLLAVLTAAVVARNLCLIT